MTKEYSQFVFDVGVSYFEDVDEVIRTLKEVMMDSGLIRYFPGTL